MPARHNQAMVRRGVFLLAALMSLGQSFPEDQRAGWHAERTPVKPFEVRDLEGRKLTERDLEGKVVLVDFWASWCGPCVAELPDLAYYDASLATRKDVLFLSLNVTDEPDTLQDFLRKNRPSYRVFLGDDLAGRYGITVYPTKLILDMRPRDGGFVLWRGLGRIPLRSIAAQVERVVRGQP